MQDSYKKSEGNAAEKAKEEIYRETIASQRAKRERFESQSKDGGKSSERSVQRNIYMSPFFQTLTVLRLQLQRAKI